jgi:Ser/Thr protein kinase RdoA (MazF antagonist)
MQTLTLTECRDEKDITMKPYNELTRLGQIRRLRQVAIKALAEYDLEAESVKFLTIETNTMFQVRSSDGRKYVLRIYSDEETTLRENRAEMFWLDVLKRDTDLKFSEPVPRRDGEYITITSVPGVPEDRRCVLFKWVPGKPLENYLNPENYYKFGQTLAKLHNHASTLNPLPSDIQPKKWDKVFYYPDEPVVYHTPKYSHLFPPERIETIDRVIELADQVFAALFADPAGQILIHGDLHFWNVHYHRGELYVIDFEDINLGYPIQDIAVTLYYGRECDGYEDWKAAFREGYSTIRTWPSQGERTIQTLMAARLVMFINYVARVDPSPLEFVEKRSNDLVQYLERYG